MSKTKEHEYGNYLIRSEYQKSNKDSRKTSNPVLASNVSWDKDSDIGTVSSRVRRVRIMTGPYYCWEYLDVRKITSGGEKKGI
jgi:hypothetical protein